VDPEPFWDFVLLAFEGPVGQIVFMLLAFMSASIIGITINRIRWYADTRHEYRNFGRQVGRSLRNHHLVDLISIAQNNRSPGAIVIATGLAAFQECVVSSSHKSAFETAQRASQLSTRAIRLKLSRGLNHMASISATIVLVGAFGACYHMLTGFKGCNGPRESCMEALWYEYNRALVPLAWSLLIAVPTVWIYRYLESQMDVFDLEMKAALVELSNYLATVQQDTADIDF
jgi:biopolymer transport protein ExbB/TolQ